MMLGSGILEDNEFFYEDFTSVEVDSACALTITQGTEFSIVITCDDNLSPYLIVEETDGLLKIGLLPYSSYNRITFKAAVVMSELSSLKAGEASSVDVSGFDGGSELSIEFLEASYGDIDLNSAGNISVTLEEASRLNVSSSAAAGDLDISCSEASQLNMDDCPAANAVVDLSEASKLWVNLSESLIGSVTDASALYCNGTADVSGLDVQFASIFVNN